MLPDTTRRDFQFNCKNVSWVNLTVRKNNHLIKALYIWCECFSRCRLHTDAAALIPDQQQSLWKLLTHQAKQTRTHLQKSATDRRLAQSTSEVMLCEYKNTIAVCDELLKSEFKPSQETWGERRVSSSRVYVECPRGETHSPESESRAGGEILCDVLLSGRSVDVPDNALHHPLDALVHSIPCEGRTGLD